MGPRHEVVGRRGSEVHAALALAIAVSLVSMPPANTAKAADAPPVTAKDRRADVSPRRFWPWWLPRIRRDRDLEDAALLRARTLQPEPPKGLIPNSIPGLSEGDSGSIATGSPAPRAKIDSAAVSESENVSKPEDDQRSEAASLLVQALGLQDSPTKVFGWLENSYTGNTQGLPANGVNFGVFPNHLADRWQGNQYYLIFENALTSDDTINFGFRGDVLFGNDWQFTKDYGLFDRAFVPNHFVGIDFPQLYGEVHLPVLTPWGVDIRGGRFYSPTGFESVQAPKRPLLSVPYTLNYTPFTLLGVIGTLHLLENNRANIYAGTVNGWDRWFDSSFKWSVLGGYSLSSKSGKTSLNTYFIIGPDQLPRFPPANSPFLPTGVISIPYLAGRINSGYGSNPRIYFSTTLTHNWTDRLTEALQTDQVLDKNTPGFGPGGSPRDTAWYSLAHWMLYGVDAALSDAKLTFAWRSEVFRDNNGAATGVAADFFETSVGLICKPRPWLWVRPEVRYDWVRGSAHPFDDGTKNGQLIVDADVIFLF